MTTLESMEQRNNYITITMKMNFDDVKVDTIYGNSSTIYSKITVQESGEIIYLKHLDTGEEKTTEEVVLEDTRNTKMNKFKQEMRVRENNGEKQSSNNGETSRDKKTKILTLKEAENALIDAGIIGKKGIKSDELKPTITNFISRSGKITVELSNKTVYVLAKDKNGEVIIETSSLGDR